jgi:phosphate starvation-inducible protein PhoH and related proteins
MTTTKITEQFSDTYILSQVCGRRDENIKLLETCTEAKIAVRGTGVTISGPDFAVELAIRAMRGLYDVVKRGYPLGIEDVRRASEILSADETIKLSEVFLDNLTIPSTKKRIAPKSLAQKRYLDAIKEKDIVFGIGPAGTGKTYLAMAMAVSALLSKRYKRIILTRPAVEAGEKLGFLPGDLADKVNPYLRPLYDALHDMMDVNKANQLIEEQVIEVAPLAFMRGRTLNNAFVILDEAQNTTAEQMKMFLTRLGFHSKAVITGDITQVDLPVERESGLVNASRILAGIEGIGFCAFSKDDVVRHPLVAKIVEAYDLNTERIAAARHAEETYSQQANQKSEVQET